MGLVVVGVLTLFVFVSYGAAWVVLREHDD